MAFGRWRLADKKVISRDDVSRIISSARDQGRAEDYLLFAVPANTGIRISEVVHLRVEDVLSSSAIQVTRRKRRKLSPEVLPVNRELHRLLADRAKKMKKGWLWPGDSSPCIIHRVAHGKATGDEKICPGGHIAKRTAQRAWMCYLKELKLWKPGRGIHTLRHYAITEFYSRHRDLRAAQVFAGHSSSTMTEVYAHAVDLAEQVAKVKPVL